MTASVELLSALLPGLLIGFLGSGHCLVMCGGIVSALQMMMPNQSPAEKLKLQLALSAGRISSYALFGALAGYLGMQAMALAGFGKPLLQLLSGLMLLLMALYISRLWTGLTALERLGKKLWLVIQPLAARLLPLNSTFKAFGYGLCWGYLPCGLVYSALAGSLASGSALQGALWMLAFGLGTLPALLLAGQAAGALQQLKNKAVVRYSVALILAAYGLQTIYLALHRLVF
jgi:sulfite exporter TauE/SafE